MTAFDRFAWFCSWCAPLGLVVTVAAGLSGFALRGGTAPAGQPESLLQLALGAAVAYVLAQGVLTLHVMTADFLTKDERSALLRGLYLSGSYGRWRAMMRGEAPS